MFLKLILLLSLLLNLFLIRKILFKTLRSKYFRSRIPTVSISKVDKDFEFEKISEDLTVPKKVTLAKSMFFEEGNFKGITSDYEAWIMSVLAKKSKKIFEFGTCSGKTTYLLSENSPNDCEIFSITLSKNQLNDLNHEFRDNEIAKKNAFEESIYEKFFFTGKPSESKIRVIFQDSKKFNVSNFRRQFDLIFIDGGHTYSCIKNDSEKALEMIKENGLIFWHDYILYKKSTSDVVKYLNELSTKYKICHIKRTQMCFLRYNK